ncbi:excalibur calcium-binding domain-containing protein [Streptomyces anulatus]
MRISAGAGALALILTGCGGDDGTTDDRGGKVAASVGPSASVERALALMDDEQSEDAGNSLDVDVLDNDSVTLENGERAALLHTYDPAELTLSIDTEPAHGSASVSGTTVTYNARDGYAGEDKLTYEVLVKGTEVPAATAVVRVTVTAPAPETTPPAHPTPAGNASKPPKDPAPAYYENCDAARAAGAAPVEEGDPGYAPHLDRDGDGVGCEPWGESASSSGGGGTSGGGGGGSVSYANCTAVRNAGAAPIRAGDPGYGRHLDRDGDGVGCE